MNATPLPLKDVKITGGFWFEKQKTNRETTLQREYDNCQRVGHLDAWKLQWKEGMPNQPHIFWDSDLAKLIEAAGYSLALYPNPEFEKLLDDVIDDIEKAQRPDGYLNSHYIVVEPENRWTNLRDRHELYCAGHLMEAAVAYYYGTGKRKLLDVLCRYADHIDRTFGPEPEKLKGYPGHEEIELALVKLAEATGNDKYLKLAKYFIDQRGQFPHYYDIEAVKRGEMPEGFNPENRAEDDLREYIQQQAHKPVRNQETAEGHSVRACYLYTGMASVARATDDPSLTDACRKIWKNIVTRRMYITGGIGSTRFGERFTFDYDLPNEEAYAETCAAIALCFFANAMLRLDQDTEYADVFERALYNSIISGVDTEGKKFFYDNLLASYPPEWIYNRQKSPERQEWFGCACCPPNIARLIASLNSYIYMMDDHTLFVNQFITSEAKATLNGTPFTIKQKTSYPWDEDVHLTISAKTPTEATIAIRIPGWCNNDRVLINGAEIPRGATLIGGYYRITRLWRRNDTIDVRFEMPIHRIYANPNVRHDAGKVALMRGPIVYCLEEIDNGPRLGDIHLPPVSELTLVQAPKALGNIPAIRAQGLRPVVKGWDDTLYSTTAPKYEAVRLTAIPYFLWANRGPGAMQIWTLE